MLNPIFDICFQSMFFMLTKSEVKYIQSLSQKKFRAEYNQFVAEGPKLINELLTRKPGWVKKIYATNDWWSNQAAVLKNKFQACFTPTEVFELEKISNLQTPQDVLAVVEMPAEDEDISSAEDEDISSADNKILALDGIQDPGNMGTIIRTAHWFGIHTIICSSDCADVFQPKVVQASMGSIFSVAVVYKNLEDFLAEKTRPVYGALLNGLPVQSVTAATDAIILIGNEGKGIRPNLISYINHPVTIPGFSDAESLNAAVAAGILLYSFTRLPI
jgi:RNA methyltransferase, TrmH family